MSRCAPDQPPVTPAMLQTAISDIAASVSRLQATGQLPKHLVVREVPEIGAMIQARSALPKLSYDPAEMACLTSNQRKAVLLHEAAHWKHQDPQIGTSEFVMSCVFIAGAGARLAMRLSRSMMERTCEAKGLKVRPRSRLDRFSWGLAALIGWNAVGIHMAIVTRRGEKQADLYAARAMQSGRPLASALLAMDRVEDMPSPSGAAGNAGLIDNLLSQVRIYGPAGAQLTHPATRVRVAYLTAYDPAKEKPSFKSKRTAAKLQP